MVSSAAINGSVQAMKNTKALFDKLKEAFWMIEDSRNECGVNAMPFSNYRPELSPRRQRSKRWILPALALGALDHAASAVLPCPGPARGQTAGFQSTWQRIAAPGQRWQVIEIFANGARSKNRRRSPNAVVDCRSL